MKTTLSKYSITQLVRSGVAYAPFKDKLPKEWTSDKKLVQALLGLCHEPPFNRTSATLPHIKRKLVIRRSDAASPIRIAKVFFTYWPPVLPVGSSYDVGANMLPPIDGWLGLYVREKKTIVLFEKAIGECAQQLGVQQEQLRHVVLLHEAGHWLSHVWPVAGSRIWPSATWESAKPGLNEFLAQATTCHALKVLKRTAELEVFSQIEKKQPSEYRQTVKDLLWADGPSNWWFVLLPHILKDARRFGIYNERTQRELFVFAARRSLLDIPDEEVVYTLL